MNQKEEAKRKYEKMIIRITEEATRLTKWEEDFIESIKSQLEERGSLSPKQAEILERIYVEKT